MIDETDSECPACGEHAAAGDCRCDGGDEHAHAVEAIGEGFVESGRQRA